MVLQKRLWNCDGVNPFQGCEIDLRNYGVDPSHNVCRRVPPPPKYSVEFYEISGSCAME